MIGHVVRIEEQEIGRLRRAGGKGRQQGQNEPGRRQLLHPAHPPLLAVHHAGSTISAGLG